MSEAANGKAVLSARVEGIFFNSGIDYGVLRTYSVLVGGLHGMEDEPTHILGCKTDQTVSVGETAPPDRQTYVHT